MVSENSRWSASSAVSSSRVVMPRMPFIGVRISWLMFARKALFAWFADVASSDARTSASCARRASVTSCMLPETRVNGTSPLPLDEGEPRSLNHRYSPDLQRMRTSNSMDLRCSRWTRDRSSERSHIVGVHELAQDIVPIVQLANLAKPAHADAARATSSRSAYRLPTSRPACRGSHARTAPGPRAARLQPPSAARSRGSSPRCAARRLRITLRPAAQSEPAVRRRPCTGCEARRRAARCRTCGRERPSSRARRRSGMHERRHRFHGVEAAFHRRVAEQQRSSSTKPSAARLTRSISQCPSCTDEEARSSRFCAASSSSFCRRSISSANTSSVTSRVAPSARTGRPLSSRKNR